MQIDLTAQGWTTAVSALLSFIAILIPPARAWYRRQPEENQTAVRGIASLLLAGAFVGGSCLGWWAQIACERQSILSFVGNVAISSVLSFSASGAVMHTQTVAQARSMRAAFDRDSGN